MTYFSRFLLLICLSGLFLKQPGIASPQATGFTSDSISENQAHIKDYKHLLTARFFALFQNASFLSYPEEAGKIAYRPNVPARLGIAGFYKWFGLGLSAGIPWLRPNTEKYGKTSVLDFRINAYGKFLTFETYFQQYIGLYVSYLDNDERQVEIIPGMRITSVGMNGTYIYNYEKFSMRASFIQVERQLKSAGSLIILPSFTFYHMKSDSGILPQQIDGSFPDFSDDILEGSFYSLGLSPGYAYTFVFFKYFYFTTAVNLGVAWHSYTSKTYKSTEYDNEFSFPTALRAALGYNSDRWFIGASFVTNPFNIVSNRNDANYYYHLAQLRFWVGTRFDAFKKKKN